MTVRFVKSLPEQYQVLLEYWEEKRKEKVEEEETEEEDETEGNQCIFVFFYISLPRGS